MFDEEEKCKQRQRAELRESYLRSLAALANCSVTVFMRDGVPFNAVHKASHPNRSYSILQEAELPSGKVPYALVRNEEVSAMTFTIKKQ